MPVVKCSHSLFLVASAIQQSLYEKTHPEDHDGQGDIGPLKEIIGTNHMRSNIKETEHRADTCDTTAHQYSLYKYISVGPLLKLTDYRPDCSYWLQWEDPIRTLGSYIGALSILFGAHYLPITQLALKAGAVTFGGIINRTCQRSLEMNAHCL